MKRYYCLLYTFVFMAFGVLSTLIGPYLQGIGFTGNQIGIVTAAGTCTTVFAAPFWGHRYSVLRTRSGRYYLVAAVVCCAACAAQVLHQAVAFPTVLCLYILLYFFQSPSTALMDTLIIDEGEQFGHIRTFGAAGFAVASFIAATLADLLGIGAIFPIYTGCLLVAVCIVLLLKHKGRSAREVTAQEIEYLPAMKVLEMARALGSNRRYVLILICAFFINGTDIANNTYFSFLYLEGGGTLAGVGIAFLLMAGSEAPFMAASDRLCRKFGQGRVLLVAMVFSIVRFGLFALGLPAPVLIALFPLQGLVNGITLVEYVRFISRVIPKELRGIGITVYYSLGSSFSTIICQLVGGRLLDHGLFGSGGAEHALLALSGPQSVYLFFALFNIVGVAVFIAAGLHRK